MAGGVLTKNPDRTNRAFLLAALVFAAVAAVLVFVALNNAGGGGDAGAATVPVVVAARDISPNTRLTEDMLEVRELPADQVLDGAYTRVELALGVPARYPIQQGEQITTGKVGVEQIRDERDLSLVLEPGSRGVAVQVDEVRAVGGLLLPGNVVDVIAVLGEETGGIPKAVTVLQGIEVLSVAQEAQEPVPASPAQEDATAADETEATTGLRGQRPNDVERQPDARSVTLSVTPAQAQLLAALQAQSDVQIWLALRPVDDLAPVQLDETNLLGFHSPPLPTPAP